MSETRIERDTMGAVEVPATAYWGAQTQRAIENFRVSERRMPPRFLRALALIKAAAAAAHREMGGLEESLARAVERAAQEVASGALADQFPLDVFQTGSGTSTNMNANEVIAGRAAELLGAERGSGRVHPNDHVNRGQSSNDVIPTALHVAARQAILEDLIPALERLGDSLESKAREFDGVVKVGRTHLQDAVPLRLGQEVGGWAAQVRSGVERAQRAADGLAELALGGTAVGTGLNAPPGFAERVIERISQRTGSRYVRARNPFEAQASRDAAVSASGELKAIACALVKVANDLRVLGSGPRCGIGELRLPAVQPGSSIMPGKVNPVICESVTLVAAQVVGNDAAIAIGGMSGQLELNAFLPLIVSNLLESIEILAAGARTLAERCIDGIEADAERCASLVEGSLALATALVPDLGYAAAASIAHEAWESGRGVREVARERGALPETELQRILDPMRQTGSSA